MPTLIIAAGADPVCATPATERFAARLKAGHAIVIPGARHEILMERDAVRELFWAAFDAFIPGTPDPAMSEPPRAERKPRQRPRSSRAAAWTRRSPAATTEPPPAAEPPSQAVTTPPAPSMMGIRATMS